MATDSCLVEVEVPDEVAKWMVFTGFARWEKAHHGPDAPMILTLTDKGNDWTLEWLRREGKKLGV